MTERRKDNLAYPGHQDATNNQEADTGDAPARPFPPSFPCTSSKGLLEQVLTSGGSCGK